MVLSNAEFQLKQIEVLDREKSVSGDKTTFFLSLRLPQIKPSSFLRTQTVKSERNATFTSGLETGANKFVKTS